MDFDAHESIAQQKVNQLLNEINAQATNDQQDPQPTQPAGVVDQEETTMESQSDADEPVDLMELLKDSTFLGDVPLNVITESIAKQFEDYIGIEDITDYVDIFYDQYDASIEALEEDEEFLDEKRSILAMILDQFVDFMARIFEQRLMITFAVIESEESNPDEVEYNLRVAYRYFILNARENFKEVVAKDINATWKEEIEDDKLFYETLHSKVIAYSPLITTITPTQFLQLSGGEEVLQLYDEGMIIGNFLRKYSMKLYQNEVFEIQLMNHVIMTREFPDAEESDMVAPNTAAEDSSLLNAQISNPE